jgi:lipoate-protein ligase A
MSVAESFSRLGQALVAGLRRLGVVGTIGDARLEGPANPRTAACFQLRRMPAILVSGKKLIGSAQRRWEKSLLQHGSLLLEFDATMHQTVFPTWCDAAASVTCLAALLNGMPHRTAVEASLAAGWAEVTGAHWMPSALTAEERGEAEGLLQARYAQNAWTFQR